MCRKRMYFYLFIMCCRIGEYISLELFYLNCPSLYSLRRILKDRIPVIDLLIQVLLCGCFCYMLGRVLALYSVILYLHYRSKHITGSKERLFIMTQTHKPPTLKHKTPENMQIVCLCHNKYEFFLTFYVFASCFRTLAVIFASDFVCQLS